MTDEGGEPAVRLFNVLRGAADRVTATPFGEVGTVFSGSGIELVWVSKQGEPVDEDWFRSDEVDLILVVQGELKFEFESPGEADLVLSVGDVLVLGAGLRRKLEKRSPRAAPAPGRIWQPITGTGWTRPITRGSGVCRVFADRRLGSTRAQSGMELVRRPVTSTSGYRLRRSTGRRLADSHLASPTSMHTVGPPPFPR